MPTHPKRLIWFCDAAEVAKRPDDLKKLRDEIGLTTIMPESFVCHTSGFTASENIAARGPFEDWRSRTDLYPRAAEGIYPPVAGTVSGFDDTPLLRIIETCRSLGIEIWGHMGLWSYGGDIYPEYAMEDIDGNPLDKRYKPWGIGLCPSRPQIVQWTQDCMIDVIQRYDIDGFDVDHARYPAPANISALFACACESCQAEAIRLGYDFPKMKEGLLRFRARFSTLTAQEVHRFANAQPSFWDFLSALDGNGSLLEWFTFRARVLAERMREFRNATREHGGPDKVFGSDVFPPSIALLGGHLYSAWEDGTDYLTGGSSSGGVVGWATCTTNLATEWAPALCRTVSGLEEADALRLIYRLFGIDDLNLPDSVEAIQKGPLPIANLYKREVRKLKARPDARRPIYPPISANTNPDLLKRLCEAVTQNECDGALFTLNPDSTENLNILRTHLA